MPVSANLGEVLQALEAIVRGGTQASNGRQLSPESTPKAVFNHAKAGWLHN